MTVSPRANRYYNAIGVAALIAAGWPSGRAAAATPLTSTSQVTATILATCTLSSASMAFGTFTGARIDTSTTFTVTCTSLTTYQISADHGLYSIYTGVYAKSMAGPSTPKLRYHLYSNAARTTDWADTPETTEFTGTGTGVAQTITVYGTIMANTGFPPGSYSDTVIMTVTY